MKFKFLSTVLAGLILSASCLVNIANAGLIRDYDGHIGTTYDTETGLYWVSNVFRYGYLSYGDQLTNIATDATNDFAGISTWQMATNETMQSLWQNSTEERVQGFDAFGPWFDDNYSYVVVGRYNDEKSPGNHGVAVTTVRNWNLGSTGWTDESYFGNESLPDAELREYEGAWVVSAIAPAAVPESSIFTLFGLGLMGLGYRRFKKTSIRSC